MKKTDISKRIANADIVAKVGDKVVVTRADGTQYIGEVIEMHQRVKNWITKVKKVNDDGTTTIEEISELVADAVIILKDVILSDVFKTIGQWFRNLFRKKELKTSV